MDLSPLIGPMVVSTVRAAICPAQSSKRFKYGPVLMEGVNVFSQVEPRANMSHATLSRSHGAFDFMIAKGLNGAGSAVI